ncbi:hypothetical protein DWB85_15850 [Seongchinamella sediminis]|uniref:Uncharacterized protein n=1 Tax=Seongchinamella sediminis TaxID=2283635 RepID=A0A3L7DVV3_9GAMM|nr:hypothetical protein [Seongchinamella sediminis]RLQ20730.1 hypothetical protein DWB85_15850 [Seongchinamella sediminis]
MDIILVILGVLGLGAIAISAYVFTVAARNYVSSDEKHRRTRPLTRTASQMVERSTTDRRSGRPVTFPLKVNGMLIIEDRRVLPDRRKAAA